MRRARRPAAAAKLAPRRGGGEGGGRRVGGDGSSPLRVAGDARRGLRRRGGGGGGGGGWGRGARRHAVGDWRRRRGRRASAAAALSPPARHGRTRERGESGTDGKPAPRGRELARPMGFPDVIGARRDRQGQSDRLRQPEGRGRQDDHHAEPCGGVRRAGPSRPVRRHGPAGQPHDVAGHRPRHARASMFDVLVHDLSIREVIRTPRDRHRVRLDRPRRGGDRDVHEDRPRALADEGAARSFRTTTTGSSSIRRRRWDY